MLETARSQTTERIKSGESRRMSHLRTLLLAAAGMIAGLAPLGAAEFTYNDKVNQDIAKKLDIPVYFALPGSARVGLPKTINTTDRLIEFKHPAAKDTVGVHNSLKLLFKLGLASALALSALWPRGRCRS